MILLEAGANPNAQKSSGLTPLHLVNRLEVISMLVTHEADASIQNKSGHTPLASYFCSYSDEKKSSTLEKLLEISATTTFHLKTARHQYIVLCVVFQSTLTQ